MATLVRCEGRRFNVKNRRAWRCRRMVKPGTHNSRLASYGLGWYFTSKHSFCEKCGEKFIKLTAFAERRILRKR